MNRDVGVGKEVEWDRKVVEVFKKFSNRVVVVVGEMGDCRKVRSEVVEEGD